MYTFWAIEDFPCFHFGCFKPFCTHGFKKDKKRQLEKIWFADKTCLGEGGFGKVFGGLFHNKRAAYKLIPIQMGNSANIEEARRKAYEEFEFQKLCSQKPKAGEDGVYMSYYEKDAEELVVSPYCCFFISGGGDEWMVLVTPRYDTDLQSFKNKEKPPPQIIKEIILKVGKGIVYLNRVRYVIQQDIKPSNILLDTEWDAQNKKWKIKKIGICDFGLTGKWDKQKRGGTPMYASRTVFEEGGDFNCSDGYAFGMLISFLVLDEYYDFLQLNFMPVEDENERNKIRGALSNWHIFNIIKHFLEKNNYLFKSDLTKIENVAEREFKISHQDLIDKGIEKEWFLAAVPDHLKNTVYLEQSLLKSLE